jgi:formamidopyrimidine-DNA glycosylase
MPELPEVETIARGLREDLCGARVAAGALLWPGVLEADHGALDGPAFLRAVAGARIDAVWRRGKVLLLDLAGTGGAPHAAPGVTPGAAPLHLAFHLRMTGRLTVEPGGTAPGVHTRLLLDLADGRRLFFADARKFGRCRAMASEALGRWPFFAALGPEPLELDAPAFAALLAGRRARIKALLLDQSVLAGVGNIYADESLFRAGIHPADTAAAIGPARLERLHGALAAVLREAIAANGSSISDYVNAHGDAGAFQNDFRVYGRRGCPCRVCATPLARTTVAGRTTTFCPLCQRPAWAGDS